MSSREILLFNSYKHIEHNGRQSVIFVSRSIDHPSMPRNSKNVRVDAMRTGLLEKISDDEVRFTEIAFFDLGGWIPSYLINWMISTMVNKNVQGLHEQMIELSNE